MFEKRAFLGRFIPPLLFLGLAMLAGGCGEGTKYPVAGRVLLDGKPLEGKEGAVALMPDASKGNKSKASPFGVLQRDGSYTVMTNGKTGAPLGWYKVVVTATEADANPNDDVPSVLNKVYSTEASTPLAIEVVANPSSASYDLKLTP